MELPQITYPKAWLTQMETLLGAEFPAFMEALSEPAVISLRVNPAKPGAQFEETAEVPWCPEGRFLKERPKFVRDPLLHAGAYYVQEASSMLIGAAGKFFPGMKALDLCAAPGGKSTLLATRVGEEGLLVANEIVGSRARVLEENISRWGAGNVVVTHNRSHDFTQLSNFFDLILIDAPCSGEGMFRKDPEVIGHWSPKAVENCVERQKEILDNIIPSLKPGGRLIYSTCTYNRQENEDIVQWMLEEEPGRMEIVPWSPPEEWGLTPGATEGKYDAAMAHTWHAYPHKVKGEGFFLAVLEKSGTTSSKSNRKRKSRSPRKSDKGPKKGITDKAVKSAKSLIENPENVHLQTVDDELEAWPKPFREDITLLRSKMNVFKAGVRLGKGNRDQFIPDHDLAMSDLVTTEVPRIELDYENAIQFLKRGALKLDDYGPKGWAIAQHKGAQLGWIKLLGNRANIHLPKHWRIRADISKW